MATKEAIVFPAHLLNLGLNGFLLAVAPGARPFAGWIRGDGSATPGRDMFDELEGAIGFSTWENARAWAHAHGWYVVK